MHDFLHSAGLGLEFLVDHRTDEVVEAEVVFLLAFFVEGSLQVRCAVELGLKAKAVVLQEGTLLLRSRVGELIGIDECGGALGRFAEMLHMREFSAFGRSVAEVAFVLLQIDFRLTLFGERTGGIMQMFLAGDELMPAVEGSCGKVDAHRIVDFSHITFLLELRRCKIVA